MAVADHAEKPSLAAQIVADPVVKHSSSARIVDLSLIFLSLIYLSLAIGWIITAGMTATIVARRTCREGSALLVFLEAFNDAATKFSICIFFIDLALLAVLLFGLCLAYVVAVVCGSGAEFKKSVFGAIKRTPEPPRAVALGLVADLALLMLTAAAIVVEDMSPAMSQGQRIASVIEDVGLGGMGAISCFVIVPALALYFWRNDGRQKIRTHGADC